MRPRKQTRQGSLGWRRTWQPTPIRGKTDTSGDEDGRQTSRSAGWTVRPHAGRTSRKSHLGNARRSSRALRNTGAIAITESDSASDRAPGDPGRRRDMRDRDSDFRGSLYRYPGGYEQRVRRQPDYGMPGPPNARPRYRLQVRRLPRQQPDLHGHARAKRAIRPRHLHSAVVRFGEWVLRPARCLHRPSRCGAERPAGDDYSFGACGGKDLLLLR